MYNNNSEPWKVTLVETGQNTMTGGRVKRIQKYVGNEPFMLTYGDGVSDVNIDELVAHHKKSGKALTGTAYKPQGKFGSQSSTGEVSAIVDVLHQILFQKKAKAKIHNWGTSQDNCRHTRKGC